ncbi:hypothetical protein COV20_04920 [Candidatus Woesearchaeota archaeon CG10_big_fil_rev_8_21_14_0_10_45_16]|nr:MAG: hypothetical protein COV20_04920 [Candidatus Woesearchaeota archaeon CG10_big_fil_rev_8_21_14_0_10_45_16]
MYTHVLLRYGEIFLKGKNRSVFERRLLNNIEKMTGQRPRNIRSRLLLPYFEEHHLLKRVFGLVSYSLAVKTQQDIEEIKQAAVQLLKGKTGSFRVETQRSDKRFPLKSPEINSLVGKYIEENSDLRFGLKSPQTLNVEINQDGAFIFVDKVVCSGGLPTGVEGKVVLFLEEEASLLAGLLFMKRGTDIVPVSVKDRDINLLQKFSPRPLLLHMIKDASEIEDLAVKEKANIVVSGQNFEKYGRYEFSLPAMRPLIAYGDEDIKEQLSNFRQA